MTKSPASSASTAAKAGKNESWRETIDESRLESAIDMSLDRPLTFDEDSLGAAGDANPDDVLVRTFTDANDLLEKFSRLTLN